MNKIFSKWYLVAMAMVLAFTAAPAYAQFAQGDIVPYMLEAEGSVADLLLGSIYDVRTATERAPSWENFLVIQNTSGNYVAGHLRFRSHTKSVEVWDHIIVLSPYDVFWCRLTGIDEGVLIESTDAKTLAYSNLPVDADGYWSDTFSPRLLEDLGFPVAGGESNAEEMKYGHFEFIGLWSVTPANWAGDALSQLEAAWGSEDGNRPAAYGPNGVSANNVLQDCPNVLTGSMELGDAEYGQYYAYNLTAVENFRTDTANLDALIRFHRDQYPGGAIVYPPAVLVHATTFDTGWCYGDADGGAVILDDKMYYVNPDWATAQGPTLRDGDDFMRVTDQFANGNNAYDDDGFFADGYQLTAWYNMGGFNAEWSLNDVEWALRKAQLWAFYYNDFKGADYMTDAVFTYPTKYPHYFFDEFPWWGGIDLVSVPAQVGMQGPGFEYNYATCSNYWRAVDDYRAGLAAAWTAIDNGPIDVSGKIWDEEENLEKVIGPSPATPRFPWLPHETNVIRVGDPENILYVPDEFTAGQFMVEDWVLNDGQRYGRMDGGTPLGLGAIPLTLLANLNLATGLYDLSGTLVGHYWSNIVNELPVIGGTVRIHNSGGASVYRSAFVPWAFTEWGGVRIDPMDPMSPQNDVYTNYQGIGLAGSPVPGKQFVYP